MADSQVGREILFADREVGDMIGEGMAMKLMRRIKGIAKIQDTDNTVGQRVESYLTSYLDHYKTAAEPEFAVLLRTLRRNQRRRQMFDSTNRVSLLGCVKSALHKLNQLQLPLKKLSGI
jgi:hypothetical protein